MARIPDDDSDISTGLDGSMQNLVTSSHSTSTERFLTGNKGPDQGLPDFSDTKTIRSRLEMRGTEWPIIYTRKPPPDDIKKLNRVQFCSTAVVIAVNETAKQWQEFFKEEKLNQASEGKKSRDGDDTSSVMSCHGLGCNGLHILHGEVLEDVEWCVE